MKNKILANLDYVLNAGLGLFNFILLAIPFVVAFSSYDYGSGGYFGMTGKQTISEGISGYRVMDLWNFGAGGVLSALVQIFVLILGILMLACGVCGLLKAFGYFDIFPEKLGKIEMKKLAKINLYAFGGLNFLLLIFLIVLCATNTEKSGDSTYYYEVGIKMSAGVFLSLIFGGAGIAASIIVPKKFPVDEEELNTEYLCGECGKKGKKAWTYCPFCGGKIVTVTNGGNEENVVTALKNGEMVAEKPMEETEGAVETELIIDANAVAEGGKEPSVNPVQEETSTSAEEISLDEVAATEE